MSFLLPRAASGQPPPLLNIISAAGSGFLLQREPRTLIRVWIGDGSEKGLFALFKCLTPLVLIASGLQCITNM